MMRRDKFESLFLEEYAPCVKEFFSRLSSLGLTDDELSAIPSLFLPGRGGLYGTSLFKIAVAGKETLGWCNSMGDSLLQDVRSFQLGKFDYNASHRALDTGSPAVWRNPFWQYVAETVGRLFGQGKVDVLIADSPVLRSVSWFNAHAIETLDSTDASSTL